MHTSDAAVTRRGRGRNTRRGNTRDVSQLHFGCVIVAALLALNVVHAQLSIPIRQGNGPLLRARSEGHLQDWAVRERQRIVGKYGPAGLQPLRRAEGASNGRKVRERQVASLGTSSYASRSTSRHSTKVSTRYSSSNAATSTSGTAPATTSTSLGDPTTSTNRTVNPRTGYANLTNYQSDLEYYAPIYVGTPPQAFNVILDTGSADFWLAGQNCTTTDCLQVPTFAANVSESCTTEAAEFKIQYGQGTASGTLWNDTVILAGRNLTNQTFALCDEVSGSLLGGNASGIMGLGFPALAASGMTPFWQNLMDDNETLRDFDGFSFYLTRFINSTNATHAEYGGVFTLGTLDNSTYVDEIQYVDVPEGSESYWVVPMTALSLNGTNLTNLGTPDVAIDTGTTLIGGPSAVIESLYEAIGGAYALDQQYEGYYTYPCDANVSIAFQFGNQTYNMSSDDLNLGVFNQATNQCLGAFFDLTLSSGSAAVISWVIGGAFLKNVYSVYRYNPGPSVGFAHLSPAVLKASNNETGSSSANLSSTAVVYPSGVFGGPTPPPNGSAAITGSPLNPTQPSSPLAANDLQPKPSSLSSISSANRDGVQTILLLALFIGAAGYVL